MASDENDNAWYLHSQGRRFGPLSEDDLRGYYRAGMVKSVDRISVPNTAEMLSAAEVATMLGETAPAGPPPPPLAPAAAAPTAAARPPAAAAPPGSPLARTPEEQAAADERAAKAIAAMNIDFAALAANSAPRKSSGWVLPAIAGVALIAMLFVALNMLRKMGRPAGGSGPAAEETIVVDSGAGSPAPEGLVPPELRTAPPPQASAEPAPVPAQGVPGDEGQVWFQRSDQLITLRDWAGLRDHSAKWVQAQPQRIEAWQALGLANARLGKLGEAESAFDRVLLADPTNNYARSVMADAYLVGKRWPEAAEAYKKLVAVAPNDSRLWNNYGVALGRTDQHVQAAAALETAVKLDPSFKEAWNNLGQLYQAQGDSGRAAAAFAQANALR